MKHNILNTLSLVCFTLCLLIRHLIRRDLKATTRGICPP